MYYLVVRKGECTVDPQPQRRWRLRRIVLVLMVVAIMAATLFSAPAAFAQTSNTSSTNSTSVSPDRSTFKACFRGKTYRFNTKKAQNRFLHKHKRATRGPCR